VTGSVVPWRMPSAQPVRPFVGVRHFGDLEEFFMQFTEMDFRVDSSFSARRTMRNRKTSPGFCCPAQRSGRRGTSELFQRTISSPTCKPTFCRWTIRVNRGDSPWASGVPSEVQNQASRERFRACGVQVPRGQAASGTATDSPRLHNCRRKSEERATSKFFSLKTNVEGIAIELPFPGKVRIHGAQEIVKAPLIFGAIAQDDVEQKAKHLGPSCNKKRYAGVGCRARIFPATHPGWTLGTLPFFGRPGFEFRDLLAQVLQEFLFAPEAGAHKRIGAECVWWTPSAKP